MWGVPGARGGGGGMWGIFWALFVLQGTFSPDTLVWYMCSTDDAVIVHIVGLWPHGNGVQHSTCRMLLLLTTTRPQCFAYPCILPDSVGMIGLLGGLVSISGLRHTSTYLTNLAAGHPCLLA